MRFLRIFPAVCAMISWPFSSSTRNVALGRSSFTTPGNSSISSLAMVTPSLLRLLARVGAKCARRALFSRGFCRAPGNPHAAGAFRPVGVAQNRAVPAHPGDRGAIHIGHHPAGRVETALREHTGFGKV